MFLFNRYILGFLFAIGLIILIIILLFSGPSTSKVPSSQTIRSYVNGNSAVEMDIYGPIVAPQNHNQVNVVIDQYTSQLTVYSGYDNAVVNSKIYNNSHNSYDAFLNALYYAGYDLGASHPTISSSIGLCATGDVYTFKLISNGNIVHSYWQTNCTSDPSTYKGAFSQTTNLFQAQIPDYNSLISGANI